MVENVVCLKYDIFYTPLKLMTTTTRETRLNVRITAEELEELRTFAESKNLSMSEFVLTAARSYIGKRQGMEERLLEVERQLAILMSQAA